MAFYKMKDNLLTISRLRVNNKLARYVSITVYCKQIILDIIQ